MGNGSEECLHRLPTEGAAGAIGDRAGNEQRHFAATAFEQFCDGKQRGLGVESVENGFNGQEIHSSLEQRFRLIGVGLTELIKVCRPESGIIHIRRERERHRQRSHGAGHEAAGSGLLRFLISGAPGDLRGGQVDLANERAEIRVIDHLLEKLLVLAAVGRFMRKEKVVQADGGGAEGIGFDDVGPGLEILVMNFRDHLRLGELEQLEAALEILARPMAEALAAIILFREFVALDHGAHGAVEEDDAFLEEGGEGVRSHGQRGK